MQINLSYYPISLEESSLSSNLLVDDDDVEKETFFEDYARTTRSNIGTSNAIDRIIIKKKLQGKISFKSKITK